MSINSRKNKCKLITNSHILRELSKHKLRLLELWRTTIRDVKVSLGNTSKVLGVFLLHNLCKSICLNCLYVIYYYLNTMSYTLISIKNSPVDKITTEPLRRFSIQTQEGKQQLLISILIVIIFIKSCFKINHTE